MKSFFTKIGTFLLCGVIVLAGCTDYSADIDAVNDKFLANASELATLKTELNSLKNDFAENGATKDQVEAVVDALESLSKALDTKADAATVQEAIKDLQDKLDALDSKHTEDVTAINGEIKSIKETLSGLKNYDDTELQNKVSEIITKLDNHKSAFEAYQQKIDTSLEDIKKRLTEIETSLPELQNAVKAINDAIATKVDAQTFNNAITALEEAIKNSQKSDSELRSAIIALNTQYSALNAELAKLKSAIEELTNVLRSIVMVPELMVNGVNTVVFDSFSFVPMADDNDEVVPVEEGTANVKSTVFPTYAYYHFNPSTFNLEAADYTLVSTLVETKATATAAATVKSVTKEGDKVKVEIERGEGTDNMFALAATLKSNGAVIYSDYAQIEDKTVESNSIKLVKTDGTAIYTNLDDAIAGDADIVQIFEVVTKAADDAVVFELDGYIEAEGIDIEAYGFEYAYNVVLGDVVVDEDGNVDLSESEGVSIVKVELVDKDGDVIRRAYVKFNVIEEEIVIPTTYYYSSATASVTAMRVGFEMADIYTWAKNLKDLPNTKETIKNALVALKNKNYNEAYVLLGGVSGFVKEYTEFTGKGEFEVRVDEIPEITDITELSAVLKNLEEKFAESDLAEKLGTLENYIPESVKNNPLMQSFISGIKNFKLSEILSNETLVNLIESAQAAANKLLGKDIFSYDVINSKLTEIVNNIIAGVENSAMTEEAAANAAEIQAGLLAIEDLNANAVAANEKLLENFANGNWGKLVTLLDSEIVAKAFETLKLTDLYNMLQSLADYGVELAQYRYELDDIELDVEPAVKIVK